MALTINHQTNDISATSGSVTIDGAAAGGGGGALEFISKTTLSSTSVVEYTGLTSGDTYFLTFNDLLRSNTSAYLQSQFLDSNDAAITDSKYGTKIIQNGSSNLSKNLSDRMWNVYPQYQALQQYNGYAYISITADRGTFNTSYIRLHSNGVDQGYSSESAQSGCYGSFSTSPTGGISGVKIFPSGGTFTSGTFNFYKVKDA